MRNFGIALSVEFDLSHLIWERKPSDCVSNKRGQYTDALKAVREDLAQTFAAARHAQTEVPVCK